MNPTWRILVGDVREQLRPIPDGSVRCTVTSPPYWGLRDYGTGQWVGGDEACDHTRRNPRQDHSHGAFLGTRGNQPSTVVRATPYRDACNRCGAVRVDKQIGMERTPGEYVQALVEVFREVRRILTPDGTLWLNIGDCYANDGKWGGETGGKQTYLDHASLTRVGREKRVTWLKPKDLVGMPWAVAFALRDDGWWLRRDIVWHKPNPLTESVKDRCTTAHEYIFMLTKSAKYYYDADAILEPASEAMKAQMRRAYTGQGRKNYDGAGVQNPSDVKRRIIAGKSGNKERKFRGEHGGVDGSRAHQGFSVPWEGVTRNKRSVWTITTQPYPDAHFATFPEEIPETCIKAGSGLGDTVLDPFCGSGTTGQVAIQLGRSFIGCELNPSYVALSRKRIGTAAPLFANEAVS